LVINIDLVLLTNFFFTALVIWIAGALWNLRSGIFNIMLGSLVSSLYLMCFLLFFPSSVLVGLGGHILTTGFIVFLVWREFNNPLFFKLFFSMYAIAFFIGGVATGVWNVIPFAGRGGEALFLFILFVLFIWSGGKCWGLFIKWQKKKNFYTVLLKYNGKEKKLTAFLDTGNRLEDRKGKPVIIVSWAAIRFFLEDITGFEVGDSPEDFLVKINGEWTGKIKIITYKGLKENGFIITLPLDSLKIILPDGEIEFSDFLMGIYHGNWKGGFEALLPGEVEKRLGKSNFNPATEI